jgi:hypothetical protein
MTDGRDYFLNLQDYITIGAFLAIGQTILTTGCSGFSGSCGGIGSSLSQETNKSTALRNNNIFFIII